MPPPNGGVVAVTAEPPKAGVAYNIHPTTSSLSLCRPPWPGPSDTVLVDLAEETLGNLADMPPFLEGSRA